MNITRRTALVLTAAGATGLTLADSATAADGDVYPVIQLMNPSGAADRPLGDESAPVTIIEYASPTCPHCASFHVATFPALKEQYIDTGKVRFIVRPFIRNSDLDPAVFMLAECSDTEFYPLLGSFFERQLEWAQSPTPRDALLSIASEHGLTQEAFDACLSDNALFQQMVDAREQAIEEFGLEATPTFYINGKQFSGAKPIEDMAAEIDLLL